MTQPCLAVRVNTANPNHHLWDNHGTWWMHYTLHLPDFTKQRVRQSLATHSVETARRRRDAVLAGKLWVGSDRRADRITARPAVAPYRLIEPCRCTSRREGESFLLRPV
ncbi:MAG: hypothetical protein PCFJNLEI_00676 [Verrucomicrobiae bacterium]|nr:hypothetical protein [Verrucomicrobiae bacterium]